MVAAGRRLATAELMLCVEAFNDELAGRELVVSAAPGAGGGQGAPVPSRAPALGRREVAMEAARLAARKRRTASADRAAPAARAGPAPTSSAAARSRSREDRLAAQMAKMRANRGAKA